MQSGADIAKLEEYLYKYIDGRRKEGRNGGKERGREQLNGQIYYPV